MQPREQFKRDPLQHRGSLSRHAWKVAGLVFAIGIPLGGATVGAVLFLLIAPLIVRESKMEGVSPWGSLGAPLLALIAVSTLSSLLGAARVDGLLFSLALLLLGGASLLGGRRVARDPDFFQRVFLPALAATAVLISFYVLYQYFGLGMRRSTGLTSYTNRMGTLLMFSGVLGLGYLMNLRSRVRWSAILYAALVGLAMSATLSRAAWVAGLVGVVILALRWPRRGLILLLIGVIAGGTLMASQPAWLGRFQSTFSIERNMDRLIMWEASAEIFRDYPILGIGPTSFPLVAPEYVKGETWKPPATPHNVILSVAAGMGLAGLGAFGWLAGRSGRLGLELWRRGDRLSLGLAAAVLALFVNDLFGQGFFTSQVGAVLWFAFGMMEGHTRLGWSD